MSKLICKLAGVRGREIAVYDNKCIITTNVSFGSILTSNALDGEKTIFYIDITGIQFKASGMTIGYLQLETPSMQMNNQSSNQFSENTFTFESGINGVTNELMYCVKDYIIARTEGYKYGTISEVPQDAPVKLLELLPKETKQDSTTPLPDTRWFCPSCGAGNRATLDKCYKCRKQRV